MTMMGNQMIAPSKIAQAILLAILMSACAVKPKIQLSADEMKMEVKSKVPLVTVVDYAPDGKTIATGGMGEAARIWDLATAKEAVKFKHSAENLIVTGLRFSPDGKSIAVSTSGFTKTTPHVTTLWDITTGAQLRTFSENFGGSLSFSPDGKLLLGQIGGFGGGAISLLDIQTGALVRSAGAASSMGQAGFTGKLSPDGKYILAWGAEIRTFISSPVYSISLLEVATGREIWKKNITCDEAAFSPDGKQILLSRHTQANLGADLKIMFSLLDTATGAQLKEFGHASFSGGAFSNVGRVLHQVRALAFSPDGKSFVSGNLRGEYKLWDLASTAVIRELKTVDEAEGTIMNTAPSARFSPNGKTVVVSSLASTRLYDLATGDELGHHDQL